MRITVCAIGRMRDKNERALADDYLSRAQALGRNLGITDIRLVELDAKQTSDQEGEALLAAAPENAFIIALDETGKQKPSRDMAAWLERLKDGAQRDVAFVIGGADGHSEALKAKVNASLSLGAMTWPHMLARIMLLEQMYRAISILARHPYHRD
ncbi:MAG: 23S rRNA (pseudouridine(1915)-N(3))-methyltransferase RlmH [Candidatus Phaeomarinobacter sp.]